MSATIVEETNVTAHTWPEPLRVEAFHGPAGEMVQAIEPQSEADPAALLTQTVVEFGNVIGSKPHFRVEDDLHRGNLFTTMVGQTSKARKGTSRNRIHHIFECLDPDWANNRSQGGLSSGEGVIWAVRDSGGCSGKSQSTGALLDPNADAGVADKRLLVFEGEFSSALRVMAREGNTLSPVLRDAWDKGDLRILTKNSPARASGAHISIIGHITRDELLRHLNATEMCNGFANRFLWVCAGRSKQLPEGGNFHLEDHCNLLERFADAIEHARQTGEVKRDERARQLWRRVYPVLSEGRPGLIGAATNRAEAQVLRLSLLYALLDCSSVIRQEHLLAALAVWDYCFASAKYIFGDALGYPEADRILSELRGSADGLTRTEIRDLFARHRSEGQIAAALKCLEEHGLAHPVSEPTAGRAIERWVAAGG